MRSSDYDYSLDSCHLHVTFFFVNMASDLEEVS